MGLSYKDFVDMYATAHMALQDIQSTVYRILDVGDGFTVICYYSVASGVMKVVLVDPAGSSPTADEYRGPLSNLPVAVLESYTSISRKVLDWVAAGDCPFPDLP